MIPFLTILFFIGSSNTWAVTAVEVGSKHQLNKSSAYHFSSKELISVHTSENPPFIIGKKIGHLHFKENNQNKDLLILNREQMHFFKNASFIVENSPFANWSMQSNKLIINGSLNQNERAYLITDCASKKLSSITIQTTSPFLNPSPDERRCLGYKDVLNIEIVFLNEDTIAKKSFGVGTPNELAWSITSKLRSLQINGALTTENLRGNSSGHSFFSAALEIKTPLTFESGSEILIKPSGVFNRQKNEWKKAVSNIELNLLKIKKGFAQTSVKINKVERTGENQIFNVEKFEQIHNIPIGKWKKIYVFQQKSRERLRSKLLGLSFLRRKTKNSNKSNKQLWIRLSHND